MTATEDRLGDMLSSMFNGVKFNVSFGSPSKNPGKMLYYQCDDSWRIYYTSSHAVDGNWAVMQYKPVGKGARTKPVEWDLVKTTWYRTHKTALKRAKALYEQHKVAGLYKWVATCPTCGTEYKYQKHMGDRYCKCLGGTYSGGTFNESVRLVWTEVAT